MAVTAVVAQIVGKQQRAQQEPGRAVGDHEQIGFKRPAVHFDEAEFPPPEGDQRHQRPHHPAQVQRRTATPLRVLDDLRQPLQQGGDGQAEDDPHHHADMQEYRFGFHQPAPSSVAPMLA
ncbi:hypothetical protein D3C73_1251970 [compost metagenome]